MMSGAGRCWEDVITVHNANDIKAKLIVRGANGPTSAKADAIINEKGIMACQHILLMLAE